MDIMIIIISRIIVIVCFILRDNETLLFIYYAMFSILTYLVLGIILYKLIN